MPEGSLTRELKRARRLVGTLGRKPFLPKISIEIRRSLAETFSTEASIDHLTAVKRLHRPLTDEVPLWEEYTDIAEILDEMDAEDREEEVLRLQYQHECRSRVEEAVRDFNRFMSKQDIGSEDPGETKMARRIVSKDDSQLGLTTTGVNELRRRPSFMADVSRGHIQVETLDSAGPQTGSLPVTSTPHVPHVAHRRPAPRVSAVQVAADLFNAAASDETSRPRTASFTKIEYVRSKTFERKPDGNETEIRAPQSTFVSGVETDAQEPAGRTVCKEPNATILKSSSNFEERPGPKCPAIAPRIASAPARPAVASRAPTRETKLQKPGKFSSKIQVLPSKASSGVPARRLPTRKPHLSLKEPGSAASVSRTSSSNQAAPAITRPSKPARLPVRK